MYRYHYLVINMTVERKRRKQIMTLLVVSMFCLTGCALMNKTPTDSVKKFLNNYKNNDQVVVDELNDYITT